MPNNGGIACPNQWSICTLTRPVPLMSPSEVLKHKPYKREFPRGSNFNVKFEHISASFQVSSPEHERVCRRITLHLWSVVSFTSLLCLRSPDRALCPLKGSFLRSPVLIDQATACLPPGHSLGGRCHCCLPLFSFLFLCCHLCSVPVHSRAGHGQLRLLPNTYSHPCSRQSAQPAVNPSSPTQQRLTRGLTT